MNSKGLILLFCLVFSVGVSAQTGKKTPQSWAEHIAQAKEAAYQEMKKNLLPVASSVVKAKEASQPFSADISGLDEMILYAWGTVDGTAGDQALWANARLIAADGSVVWLNDMEEVLKENSTGRLFFNTNERGQTAVMKGKEYDRTVLMYGNTQVRIPLEKNILVLRQK